MKTIANATNPDDFVVKLVIKKSQGDPTLGVSLNEILEVAKADYPNFSEENVTSAIKHLMDEGLLTQRMPQVYHLTTQDELAEHEYDGEITPEDIRAALKGI